MIYVIILLGAAVGLLISSTLPILPYSYTIYLSVAIIAALDSVFGGISAIIKNRFDMKVFLSGFFGNAILSVLLAYLGQRLNVDIYLATIIVFVGRMFNNLSIIRRHFIDIWSYKINKKLKKDKEKNADSNQQKTK